MSSQRQSSTRLENFRAARGHSSASLTVDISQLTLGPGEFCALVGPNGAGKSTLLLALAGLLPYAGTVRIGPPGAEHELRTLPPARRAERIAFLGASEELAFAYTVRQVVTFARAPHQDARLTATPEDMRIVDHALAVWGLQAFADRPANQLSAGETRRVELASIFAQEAPLVLLDEPVTALDLRQSAFAHERLAEHVRETGASCLFSTHDLPQARAFATRALVLVGGHIVQDGPAGELLREDRLACYFDEDRSSLAQPA